MPKHLLISFIDGSDQLNRFFEKIPLTSAKYPIDVNPWHTAFTGKVSFDIAHHTHAILLKYLVVEPYSQALYTQPNDPVYKDSCVEFFIGFNSDSNYYNFEFNNQGTCLAAYGNTKHDRCFLPESSIKAIETNIFSSTLENGLSKWQLNITIPKSLFLHHRFDDAESNTAKVNFYKCGDDLPQPHFLCWNHISAPEPEFHLPAYFGNATFLNN